MNIIIILIGLIILVIGGSKLLQARIKNKKRLCFCECLACKYQAHHECELNCKREKKI